MRGSRFSSWTVIAIAILLGVVRPVPAQQQAKPPVVKPPVTAQPPQVQIRDQILPYTVRLARPVPRPVSFGDGGAEWQGGCEGRTCTVTGPRGAQADQVCRNVPPRFGPIEGVVRGAEAMGSVELKECNQMRLPAMKPLPPAVAQRAVPRNAVSEAAKPAEIGPQPEPPTRDKLPGPEKTPTDLKEADLPRERVPISGGRLADANRIKPLPREIPRDTPEVRLAELTIMDVRRCADAEGVIELGEVVPVEVVVGNTGSASATVRAGTPTDPRLDGGIMLTDLHA